MLTNEGADDAEIIVRPSNNGRWRVEVPHERGVFVTLASDQNQAVTLARQLRPNAQIRLLPAAESVETLSGALSQTRRPRDAGEVG